MKTKTIITVLAFLAIAIATQAQYYRSNGVSGNSYSGYSSGYRSNYQSSSSYSTPSVRYQSIYQRHDGTVVQGHYKTQSNSTNWDNFSTRGNVNPYTGKSGSRAPDYSPGAYNYGKGHTIQTGPRGGQYYININGNKTYVPKR